MPWFWREGAVSSANASETWQGQGEHRSCRPGWGRGWHVVNDEVFTISLADLEAVFPSNLMHIHIYKLI